MWWSAVLVRDGFPYGECTLNTTLQVKSVTISTSKTLLFPTPFIGHNITRGCDKNNGREN